MQIEEAAQHAGEHVAEPFDAGKTIIEHVSNSSIDHPLIHLPTIMGVDLSVTKHVLMLWIVAGLAIGLAGAGIGARYVEPLLFETRPYDPLVFAAAPLLLIAVALIASAVPAWRAASVDPNLTLRAE